MLFADTFFWLALFDQNDNFHRQASEVAARFSQVPLLTTESVLTEFLAVLRDGGPHVRREAVGIVQALLHDSRVEVLPQTHGLFLAGLDLYGRRLDKRYSQVDSISMEVMRERGISEVLTHDHHFAQEGFVLLL